MIVTNRDKQVIEFIEQYKIATTDTILELFYPSLNVAHKRLKLLHDNKLLKRDRDHFTSQYYYYIRKPKQLKHSLLLTDFYRELHKISKIELFKNEFIIEDIRADGFVAYEINNKKEIAFVEVELSNKGLDLEKYERLYKSSKYKKYFPIFPNIIIISNRSVPKTKLKIIKLSENIQGMELIL